MNFRAHHNRRQTIASLTFLLLLLAQRPAAAGDLTPDKVQATLPELEQLIQQTMKRTGIPGLSIAVVHQDRVIYLKGFGVRKAGAPETVDADTVFQVASVSKPITSTVLAVLAGEGSIDWDDRVNDRNPEFSLYEPAVTRELTLRDLLCHRSGLADHAGDLLEDLGYNRAEILHRLRYMQPASSFRSHYAYTNFGYTEAAVAAAKASGKVWEDLAAEKLYQPLGMTSTSSRFADYAGAENRAHLHVKVDGRWVAKYVRDPDAQSPAGGVSSTVRDMSRWLRLHLGEGKFEGRPIVDAKALAETHRPQIISRAPQNPAVDRPGLYGLGWNVSSDDRGRVRLGHSGGFDLGGATFVGLIPAEELGIVILTNAAPQGIPESIGESFFDLVFAGKIRRDWVTLFAGLFQALSDPTYGSPVDYTRPPQALTPPLPFATYVGTYSNPLFGQIEVVEQQGALVLKLGPKQVPFPLQHWNRDTFRYQPVGEQAGGISGVLFQLGPDQKGTGVMIENLNVNGQGTFRRMKDEAILHHQPRP